MARFRSPRYPFIDLPTAVEAVRKLQTAAPAGRLRDADAAEAWGKGADSSAVFQTVGALRQFGLIAVERDGEERILVFTELAKRVLDRSDDTDALQKAAMTPGVFDKLWRQVESGQTSRLALLQSLTTQDPPFSPKAADHVLDLFQSSMKFAGHAVGEVGARLDRIQKEETAVVEEVMAPGAIRILFPRPPTGRDYELLQAYIDDKRPRNLGEEVLAIGKIRIQYRGEPERKDFQEARDHFERELKG